MAADLDRFLSGTSPLTLLAPTDAPFGKLPSGVVVQLLKLESRTALNKILEYHLFLGNMTLALTNGMNIMINLTMFTGGIVQVSRDGNTIRVNNASMVRADIFATNGILHAIDTVLLPSFDIVDTDMTNGNFKTLLATVRVAGLVKSL